MFRSAKFAVAMSLLLLGQVSVARGDTAGDRELAGARSRLGETPEACRALSQSLESYRLAAEKDSGVIEGRLSGVLDDSDGMAEIRARFGCAKV